MFALFAPAIPQDDLPTGAWVPFLGTRAGMLQTRDDAWPFNVAEQRRNVTVGASLTCHTASSPPIVGAAPPAAESHQTPLDSECRSAES